MVVPGRDLCLESAGITLELLNHAKNVKSNEPPHFPMSTALKRA